LRKQKLTSFVRVSAVLLALKSEKITEEVSSEFEITKSAAKEKEKSVEYLHIII
jgi:hypothetical protein